MNTNLYRGLVESVELKEITIMEMSLRRSSRVPSPIEIETDFEVETSAIRKAELVARALFNLKAKSKGKVKPLMRIDLEYRVVYRVADLDSTALNEDLINEFLKRNVPINVWPYIRENVMTLTGKMGLTPLILPVLKLTR